MPMYEFECPVHGKFEVICDEKYDTQPCPELQCVYESPKIEWSVPARRNPQKGVQT